MVLYGGELKSFPSERGESRVMGRTKDLSTRDNEGSLDDRTISIFIVTQRRRKDIGPPVVAGEEMRFWDHWYRLGKVDSK